MPVSSLIKLLQNFLLIFFVTGQLNAQVIGKYPVSNFSPTEYKGGIQNIDFAQNRDMNLFVANNLGVLSFNGNVWGQHAFNTGKKQRSLAFDESSDRLYVGSQGDFGYFEKDWTYVSLLNKIPEDSRDFDEVWDVFVYDLDVYFCTFKGIYIYDGETVKVIKKEDGLNRSYFAGKNLFTQTPAGELFQVDQDQLITTLKQNIKNEIVAAVVSWEEGYLIFYNSGIIELSTVFNVEPAFPDLSSVLQGKYVNHVLQLSDTRLVISTQRQGLYLFNPQNNSIENISKEEGLQSNACLRAFQDHSGNLWVGMQNGMALVDINSPLRLINQDVALQGSGYEAYESIEGTYYTTSNGIYFKSVNDVESQFLKGTEGPAYGIQMINDDLYAGHHTGLFLLRNGTAQRIASTNGMWQVKQLKSNPEYAVGGTYSGLYLFKISDAQPLLPIGNIKGFNESSRFFEEDRKGMIWVGQYYKGLYHLRLSDDLLGTEIVKDPGSYKLDIGEHYILTRIDNELYLGTDQGIFKIDQSNDTVIESELFSKEVSGKWVYLLEQDNQKNVHVFTEDRVGFFRQVSPNNYVYIPSSLFQLRQTFNNDLLRVSKNVSNGVLFNANEGFIHYSPSLEDRLTIEKIPLVNRIYNVARDSILYERLPFQKRPESVEPIRIIQGTKVLQFIVESFKFKDVNNRQFRYYLDGFDTHFSNWTNTHIKEYTNLREGNYRFYVQTVNYLGEIVTNQPIDVKVDPPFFKSTFAKILYSIGILILLFFSYRFQRQYYKGKASRLEQVKQEELESKQKEVQELKENQIKTELRHVNNQLAASTMNLVVKNEFMENIKEEIKNIKLNGSVDDTRKALNHIIKEIDTTLKVQDDWKQFEYHFDQVHGDFLSRLTIEFRDLTPGEQKLCAFLRLKMDTKEIANLMGVSLRGVEVARYRLRKKLGLDKHQNLSKFVLEY